MAWSLLVPLFFVVTGTDVDLDQVAAEPGLLVTFVVMILLVRGGVVWLRERFTPTGTGLTTGAERAHLALYAAAGLPIIVAVTEVAVAGDLMPEGTASVLVAAGIVSVLVFPLVARLVPLRPTPASTGSTEPAGQRDVRGARQV